MPLPNPTMSFTPFDPLPASDLNDLVENIESLQDWSAFDNATLPFRLIQGGTEIVFDHVASGLVWSGDSYGASLNASMTSGVVYVNGKRVSVNSVSARPFTASRDTYVDVGEDGVVDYNAVVNNAASPALAANHVRIAIIVTGAGNILSVGSVNQGQENKLLPIASSIPYAVTDSLGNLICPRDPNRKLLGYRQVIANVNTLSSTSPAQITGLSCPVIVPTGRKAIVSLHYPAIVPGATIAVVGYIFEGTIGGGGTQIAASNVLATNSQASAMAIPGVPYTTSGSKTFNAGYAVGSSSMTLGASSTSPAFIKVELE